MRAPFPPADAALIARQFEIAPGIERVRALSPSFAAATPDTVLAIVEEAAKFATTHLAGLNDVGDAQGCRLEDGRVRTPPGHKAAWDAFVAGGWSTLDHPEDMGGQGLPLALAAAVQEVFDRACPAFGMLPVPQRSAAKLVAAWADAATRAEWLPRLVAGEWGATICISEVDAGSDAGRIRTRAVPNPDGSWSITGEKCWISFGDHDLTSRIGHCLLARTSGAAPGGAGLSLFLVPDSIDGPDGSPVRNAVQVRRIEEKMGLHASPTCALGFEGARGVMLGSEGRGLAQMFVMITNMRLSTGVQGLGIAGACADLAMAYAHERRQGGPSDAPVLIADHADVQRELLDMAARVETLRGLVFALANHADLAAHDDDPEAKADAAALVQWLLPIVKTTGGEVGFDVASAAIQVLGGAGYTREWPAEQGARDARVITIFEGTTGIQALDLLHRRTLRGDGRGLAVFLAFARQAHAGCPAEEAAALGACLDHFEGAVAALRGVAEPRDAEAGATAFLHLAALAATGWIAARFAALNPDDPATRRLVACGRYWLAGIGARAAALHDQAVEGADKLIFFQDTIPS
jgi:3-(methylthio)propanoyl-CoA dehydrogenase